MGSERAGDVLVSLADARRMPFVDPANLVLIGSSHGGWAIMDLFALDPPRPAALQPLRRCRRGRPIRSPAWSGRSCSTPTAARPTGRAASGWGRKLPTLFLLSASDIIAPAGKCIAIAERLAAEGVPVETRLFEGVTPRLRPGGAVGVQPARVRRRGDRAGARGGCGLPRPGQNGQMNGTRPTATTKYQSMNGRPNFQ